MYKDLDEGLECSTYFDGNLGLSSLLQLGYIVPPRSKNEAHEVVLREFLLWHLHPRLEQPVLVLHAGWWVVGGVERFQFCDCCVPLVLQLYPRALNP